MYRNLFSLLTTSRKEIKRCDLKPDTARGEIETKTYENTRLKEFPAQHVAASEKMDLFFIPASYIPSPGDRRC